MEETAAIEALDPLYRVTQVAEYCKTSPKVIWKEIAEGNLPAVKVRGRLRVHKSALTAYLARGGGHGKDEGTTAQSAA